MLAHSFLIKSSSKLLVTRTGIKAQTSLIWGLRFPWPIYIFLCPQLRRSWRGILVSGCASVHQEPCMLGFWNFTYRILMKKYLKHVFFFVWVISLSGVMPLWIKSEWNLMYPLSYEPCMLRFWNFIYGFLVEKLLTHIFFLSELPPFLELCPFKKLSWNLVSKIPQSIWARGLKLGLLIGDDE